MTATDHAVASCTVDITPDRPLELFGFESRTASTSIRDRLEANVLSITPDGGEGRPTYLVATDTLYGGALRERILARLLIDDDQLLVCGSHTHTAPGVDAALPGLGPTHDAYVQLVADRIVDAIEALEPLRDACVGWATGETSRLFMNRRRPTFGLGIPLPRLGRVVIAPHTRGDLDPILRAAVVTGEGNPIAVLWGTSCHPVCAPDTHAVSADYPGEVRVALRRFFGTDLPVLFLQGFSGDVRPNTTSRRPPTTAKQLGYFVAAGCHRFVEQDERAFGSWCELLAEAAVATVGRCSPAEPVTLRSTRVERNIPGWERSPQMHLIELAPDLAILAVNAEVVSSRAAALPTMSQRDGLTIPVGCCDSVIGYWPTDRMRAEGGYEAVRSCSFFPPVDFAVVDGPDKLWNEMVSALCTKNRMR